MRSMDFISNPAVSCVLFPADDPGRQIDLFVSDDYAVGKLIRSGLDAVYGTGRRGQRTYSADTVRRGIFSIDEHLGRFKGSGAKRKALVHQGHGNIGLNSWAVSYANTDTGQPDLIIPNGEPLHERIYPCFVKTLTPSPIYDITDLMFFCPPDAANRYEVVDWDPGVKAPQGALIDENPDRELRGDAVYLPIWDNRFGGHTLSRGLALTRQLPDSRVDWTESGVRFARVPRNCRGTIDAFRPCLVPVQEDQTGFSLLEPLHGVAFAFFGIPVETLAATRMRKAGSSLAALTHYFYDLRHLFDLVGVGTPEFYLLEFALKRNDFTEARRFLAGAGRNSPTPLRVDIGELRTLAHAAHATSSVLAKLADFLANPQLLVDELIVRGYEPTVNAGAITTPGQFSVNWTSTAVGATASLYIWPRRNCYSYSFLGLVTGPGDQRYVLLAATGGHGGMRPPSGVSRSAFPRPAFTGSLQTSFELEKAVGMIIRSRLTELWRRHRDDPDAWDIDSTRLLLLDQGGDVHQWIGTGGVNYVIGSSTERNRLSAMLAVMEP